MSASFFIDKTHTDVNDRLCLEPFRFTLRIFKRTVRNHHTAWRTLGYIIDQAKILTEDAKQILDYHVMIDKILESFKYVQSKGISWNLYYQEKYKPLCKCHNLNFIENCLIAID